MRGSSTEIVKNSLHQTLIVKKGHCPFSHTFPSPILQTYICSFPVFKKVLLIASSVWPPSGSQSSNSAVLPAPPSPHPLQVRTFAVLVHMSHSDGRDLCSPALHASVVFTSLFGLFI